ncbi:Xaa-Pro dipeptidase [Dirofilaria immitis]|nr:Xaa-Pro dipeptidase [Dirofilaria immitis]
MSFTMGNGTYNVSAKLFAENRIRLVEKLRNKVQTGSIVLLKGGVEQNRYNTDALDLPFRQKANNSDSNEMLEPPTIDGLNNIPCDTTILYPVMAELRVFKTDQELNVVRYVCKVASEAHKAVMKAVKPGMYEYQLESLFRHHCYYYGGCRHLAYTCIASSGCNGSILHYGHENAPNTKKIINGDLCLLDMGPEYNCYASDITTTFPCNGVRWNEMHMLAELIILSHLKDAGILKGNLEEMMEARMGAIFMPHGLGHFMGLDVHDCGGYLGDAEFRSTLPGLKALRTTRILRERMVITIEPGCYFIDTLLDAALNDPIQKKFIVEEKLNDFRGFGGVRIEDDIIIWADGNERLSNVPRTIDEIEQFMSGR